MKSVKLLVMGVVAALSSLTASAESYLQIMPTTLNTDNEDEMVLSLELVNDNSNTCAFQCDIDLPAGMKVVLDDLDFPDLSANSKRVTKYHSFAASYQEDGSLRILFYSTQNVAVKGNSGEVLTIPVTVDSSVTKGECKIVVRGQEINTYDASLAENRITKIEHDPVTTTITVTAIESVKADAENGASTVYTIDGKKVNDTKKGGVYIKNGKKVLVK